MKSAKKGQPRFSIRYKFLAVMTVLLAICVSAYLLLSVRIFKSDKTQLVFDLNRSTVKNLSADLNNQFQGLSDKMEIFAFLANRRSSDGLIYFQNLIKKNSLLAYISLRNSSGQFAYREYFDPVFLETYNLKKKYFEEELPGQRPLPMVEIQKEGEALWNASTEGGPPLIGYGRSVIQEREDGTPLKRNAIIAYVRVDRILDVLSNSGLGDVAVLNKRGELLVSSQGNTMHDPASLVKHPLVERALDGAQQTTVATFDYNQSEHLGAFTTTFRDKILVLSWVESAKVFGVVHRLVSRTVVFGLIVVTLTFIAAILFSRSLTRPLDIMMAGMGKVGAGDLHTQIDVKTRDELAILAGSFNEMIVDLRHSRQELEQINQELEQKVKERTRKLEEQNIAVKQAQEALIKTTRLAAVGEIAGRAAHEVLNPLTSLLARLQRVNKRIERQKKESQQLIHDIFEGWNHDIESGGFEKLVEMWQSPSSVNPKQKLWDEDIDNLKSVYAELENERQQLSEDTGFLLSEAERISRIVQGMRSLSIVKGNRRHHYGHEILKNCTQIMADLFGQYNVEFTTNFEADKDLIHVDRDEFIQVITNLLRNSLQAVTAQYNGTAGGEIKIDTLRDGEQLIVHVVDNGVGIPDEAKERLFENNFSTKDPEEGTGLGLSISRRFIRAYGGDITLMRSLAGKETVFEVRVPLVDKHKDEVAA